MNNKKQEILEKTPTKSIILNIKDTYGSYHYPLNKN